MEDEIQKGVSLNSCSKLLEFAAADDLISFQYEIEASGADVDQVNFWYGRSFGSKKMGFVERTPIMIASLFGSIQVLNYILKTGKVDVNRASGSDGATPLHCAAAGGALCCVEAVELLIAASGDTKAVDANGKKPGEVIAPGVKSKRRIEILLNGEEGKTGRALTEKKEYPIDVSLPDINVGLYGSDEFRMYSFKVKPCSRAYSHDWTECPFVHPGENARRRDPRKYNYTCVPCPEFKKGACAKSDTCEYAHGVFESWLHPAQYRTRLCKDETNCSRKVCFFAHKPDELRPLYAATGSALPSPKSEMSTTPPGSPSVMTSSSPMWSALQLPGSRLKTAFNARDIDLNLEMLGLERIRTQQMVEEMAGLSSPYRDLKPTNLDDVFGSLDPAGQQIRQNMNNLRASYPNMSSPSRYGYDSSAAVAAAVMNSRSAAFSKRSQSFVDRSGGSYRYGPGPNSPVGSGPMPVKHTEWGSPDGKLEWGFKGQEANKLRKSASFGIGSGDGTTVGRSEGHEPDVSWVNTLVKDGGDGIMSHWMDQMYIEEQTVA